MSSKFGGISTAGAMRVYRELYRAFDVINFLDAYTSFHLLLRGALAESRTAELWNQRTP